MWRALPLSLLIAAGALLPPADDDAGIWLRRLASSSAQERALAQRWLASHLETGDYPELAVVARRADAELRRRLLEALSADDRHLELVVLLASEEAPELAQLGEAAFAELVASWSPRAAEDPASAARVLEVVGPVVEELYALPATDSPVALDLERVARLTDLPVPLIVAPEIQDRRSAPRPRLEGTASSLLAQLSQADRSSFAGIGDWDDRRPRPASFVVASTRGAARRNDGLERLLEWCRRVESTPRPSLRTSAAARALASTGWPAALAWLERRWLGRRDRNALEGLLTAAERGRVAPGLTGPQARREVLRVADLALASGEADGVEIAERIARALAAMGPITPRGVDPAPVLVEGWAQLSGPGRWVRLVALEGTPSTDATVLATLRGLVRDPARQAPGLRFQALRALAHAPAEGRRGATEESRPGQLAELVTWARDAGLEGELAALLVACGVPPAFDLLESPRPSERERAAVFLCDWAWRAGDARLAAELLREHGVQAPLLRAASSPWVGVLESWVARDGPVPVRSLVASLGASLAAPERETLERTALLAGALSAADQVRRFDALAARPELDPIELELVASLVAGPRGASARERLLVELAARPTDAAGAGAIARACELAAVTLRRARQDAQLAEFSREVRVRVLASGHVLRERLSPPRWPPVVIPRAVRLDLLDRRLPAGV